MDSFFLSINNIMNNLILMLVLIVVLVIILNYVQKPKELKQVEGFNVFVEDDNLNTAIWIILIIVIVLVAFVFGPNVIASINS